MNFKKYLSKATAIVLTVFALGTVSPFMSASAATSENLAVFSYPSGTAKAHLDDYLIGKAKEGHTATGGVYQDGARLFANLTDNYKKLNYSKAEYTWGGNSSVTVPVLAPGTADDGTAETWGDEPYFRIECSTAGYESITFTAKVGGTKKGPANWKLQFSANGTDYTDVYTASTVTKNKNLDVNEIFSSVSVPDAADLTTAYFKIVAYNTTTIGGGSFSGITGGEAAINDVYVTGVKKSTALSAPVSDTASGKIGLNTKITLSNAEGGTIKYSINGGEYQTYTEAFAPFDNDSHTTSVTVKAYAVSDGYTDSSAAEFTYTTDNAVAVIGDYASLTKGQTYKINYAADTSAAPKIIAAGYNTAGNSMDFCSIDPENLTFTISSDTSADKFKIMMWNNFDELVPLAPIYEISVQ